MKVLTRYEIYLRIYEALYRELYPAHMVVYADYYKLEDVNPARTYYDTKKLRIYAQLCALARDMQAEVANAKWEWRKIKDAHKFDLADQFFILKCRFNILKRMKNARSYKIRILKVESKLQEVERERRKHE